MEQDDVELDVDNYGMQQHPQEQDQEQQGDESENQPLPKGRNHGNVARACGTGKCSFYR